MGATGVVGGAVGGAVAEVAGAVVGGVVAGAELGVGTLVAGVVDAAAEPGIELSVMLVEPAGSEDVVASGSSSSDGAKIAARMMSRMSTPRLIAHQRRHHGFFFRGGDRSVSAQFPAAAPLAWESWAGAPEAEAASAEVWWDAARADTTSRPRPATNLVLVPSRSWVTLRAVLGVAAANAVGKAYHASPRPPADSLSATRPLA